MMRLRRLELETFGHFTDRAIDFGVPPASGADFHIIFGRNEAGKSTLMEGYLRLLFGFPAREPYAFKHQRPNLRVGCVLDIDGVEHRLTRVARGGALVDANGQQVPDMLLDAALRGIGRDDYRKLLCLDDETIEKGGEEITKSQGDIGKLLFSAAAGISDLSQVLEDVETRNRQIYLKGGSKSVFAELKRLHSDIVHQIKEHDVSAAAYRGLRQTRDEATAQETALREQKRDLSLGRQRLTNLVQAYPLAAAYRDVAAALDPIAHYPETLDIGDDQLVALLTRRTELVAKREHAAQDAKDLAAQLASLHCDPEVLAIADKLESLATLKSQVVAGQIDLPKRKAELAEEQAQVRAQLGAVGLKMTDDMNTFSDQVLSDLQRARDAVVDAAKSANAAQDEASDAREKHREAERLADAAESEQTDDPALDKMIALADADDVLNRYTQAQLALQSATQDYDARLRDLSRQSADFTSVPVVRISHDQAQAQAAALTDTASALKSADQAVRAAYARWRDAQAKAEIASGQPDLVDDALATETRARRDRLWSIHKATLDTATADAFEAAMRAGDIQSDLRARQSTELAEARQAHRLELETRRDHEAAVLQRDGIHGDHDTLADRLKAQLEETGLPDTLSANDFAGWVHAAERASAAQRSLRAVEQKHAALLDQAHGLHGKLAALFSESDASLGGLFKLAKARLADCDAQRQATRLAKSALRATEAELARRHERLEVAQEALESAKTTWRQLVAAHLPDLSTDPDTWDGLPALLSARETQVRITGLQRQINGITQDRDRFTAELDRLNAPASDLSVTDRYMDLLAKVEAARQTDGKRKELQGRLEESMSSEKTLEQELDILDGQVRTLARLFDDTIPTESLGELRHATSVAQKAIDLRAERDSIVRTLLTLLDMDTARDALELLARQSMEAAQTDLAEVTEKLDRLDPALDAAIETRSRAQFDLDAVGGDNDIALLTEARRTVEEEMQATLLVYLKGRFGHGLAEEAIRRYRDSHRSGMLKATEQAFSDLTQGAYGRLTTQPGDKGEVLMAVQTSDGVSKEAAAMSKGTRFQLYLALRAAAYDQMAETGKRLPFFCDDIFETFDEDRTRAACTLMQRIGQRGQAIYLTHHRHVVEIAREVCGAGVVIHDL